MLISSVVLLAFAAQTTTQTGTAYELRLPVSAQDSAPELYVAGQLTQSGGATSPTAAVYVEISSDGTNWITLPVEDLVTDADETIGDVRTMVAFRYIRAKVVIAGGTPPSVTARIILGATKPVQFVAVT